MSKGTRFVIGMDLGDRVVHVCMLDRKTGEVVWGREEVPLKGPRNRTGHELPFPFFPTARARPIRADR